jgi:DNA-binding CsgD family transcriptional regulator
MKEVAGVLAISPRTVEFHKYRIMQLLGLKSGAELVQYAIRHGLIAP